MITPTTPQPTAKPTPGVADSIGFVLMATLQTIASLFFFCAAPLLGMASDSCGSPAECDSIEQAALIAMFFVWAMIIVAALVAGVGAVRAGRRRESQAVWPLLGTVIVVFSFFIAVGIASPSGA